MYFDKEAMFSDKQAVTASVAATDTLNSGPGDSGASDAKLVVVAEGYTGTGSLAVELQTADEVNGSGVLTSPVTIATYTVTNATLLAGGNVVATGLPRGLKQYVGVKYTVTGAIAGGNVTAGIVLDV